MAIMMVVRPTLQNTLDEGAYREILNASGYVVATAQNTAELLNAVAENAARFQENRRQTNQNLKAAHQTIKETDAILDRTDALLD